MNSHSTDAVEFDMSRAVPNSPEDVDPVSEAVAKLPAGEEVFPNGKASGAGEFWYMVRTKSGAIGWVRGAEVEGVKRK